MSKENRNVPFWIAERLAALAPGYPDVRLCVGFSGGLDSLALLHATREVAAVQPGLRLRALHVDHGLQPASPLWAARCAETCTRLAVPVAILELHLAPADGASVEAEARRARYAALAAELAPGECLLTAHHADDQLETVLLQLFRGAGVAGLAAMPASAALGAGLHLRPLLDVTRDELAAYATGLGLDWIEDPMNAETRYDRAYLRREVLPAVRARWPAVATTAGRSAAHLAGAQHLLDVLAATDAVALVDAHGHLAVRGLSALAPERQANVLRWWIVQQGLGVPSTARLGSILRDVVAAGEDARPVVTWPGGEVRRHRDRLYAMQPLGPVPSGAWELRAGERLAVAGVGILELHPAVGQGVAVARFPGPYTVRLRRGGETLHAAGRGHAKPVSRLLQESAMPSWLRARVPLLCADGQLVAVGGGWVAKDAAAGPGEEGLVLSWSPANCEPVPPPDRS